MVWRAAVPATVSVLAVTATAAASFPGANGPLIWQYGGGQDYKGQLRIAELGGPIRAVELVAGGWSQDVAPPGNSLVTVEGDENLSMSSLSGRLIEKRRVGPDGFCSFGVALAPDGRGAAAVGPVDQGGNCYGDFVYTASTGAPPQALVADGDSNATSQSVDWSPRSDLLAIARTDDVEDRDAIYTIPSQGGSQTLLDGDSAVVGPPSFSPTGHASPLRVAGALPR